MRQSTIAATSLSLVLLAGAAILDAAYGQSIPVEYKTDPGQAHPRYIAEQGTATKVSYHAAKPYSQDPIAGISRQRSVSVQPGDTVYAIGRRYDVAPNDIIALNKLRSPYQLRIGQEILLPLEPETNASKRTYVPVSTAEDTTDTVDMIYRVQPGDTLYSLSRRFDVEVNELAHANDLRSPYSLAIDQRLVIPMGEGVSSQRYASETIIESVEPIEDPSIRRPRTSEEEPILISKTPGSKFAWPLRGSIVRHYGMDDAGVRNDGINIAAPIGAPIRSAADGEVVYTGSELEGYGNLLLVRHDDGWVSAYAHTDSILVEKGDRVRQGQVIAKVGRTGDVDQPQLHFELRHELKPRNPIAALNGTDLQAASDLQ